MAGTAEDAKLIVQLAQWAAMLDLTVGISRIFADDFNPETATADDPEIRKLFYFYETVGTLVKNDLLDRDLVLDWLWVAGIWERLAPAALAARETSTPRMFENFEALAKSQAG
jgi:hypothetical protein